MSLKILVTGAGGQLGKTIEELYSKNDYNLDFTFVTKNLLNISNQDELKLYFANNTFDYCINCAAYTNVEQAEKTPKTAYEVNAEGVKKLAEICESNNIILIHISTDYVFDGEKEDPYTIKDATNPINEYGKSKLLGEEYLQEIMDQYFIIRTSWLYSKKYGHNFYRTILALAKTKKELSITTEQIGCPTNTENLANYIIEMIVNKSEKYGIKHFSGKKTMTWYSFAKQILFEHLYTNVKLIKARNYRTFAKRPKNSVLSKSE
jgi:dTDP-4-dehydrorhamnose reductase